RFGIVIKVVVVKPAHVLLEWPGSLQLLRTHMKKTVLHSRKDEWKCTAAMRQYDVEAWKFVERAGEDELRGSGRMLESKPKPIGETRRAGQPLTVNVRVAIQRMKQQRISQFLASREKRFKLRFK